jgi:hypothetical protein
MAKKEHNPVEALKKAFNEEVNDTELQERYDRFIKDLDRVTEGHNKLVTEINQNLEAIHILKDVVYKSAIQGILVNEATLKIKELEAVNVELMEELDSYKDRIQYNKDLIEKYKDWSGRKLFVWWQVLKVVDPNTEDWMQFRETFKDKII